MLPFQGGALSSVLGNQGVAPGHIILAFQAVCFEQAKA